MNPELIVLPEVQFTWQHFVQCSVHPGPDRPAYAVCPCVLQGAAIAHHKEPGPQGYGYALCEECRTNPNRCNQWITACPQCVEYHLLSRPVIFIPDPTLADLRLAERDGYLASKDRIAKGNPAPPPNPYKGLLAWAFELGWRSGVCEFNLKTMGAVA